MYDHITGLLDLALTSTKGGSQGSREPMGVPRAMSAGNPQ